MKIFDADFRHGQFIDQVNQVVPVNTATVVKQQEKGRAACFDTTADLDGYGIISGVKTIVSVVKHSADTKLFQDDGSDKLEISGGAMSGTGMTQNYVNNIDTDSVTNNIWQLIITEFSAGINFATDFEINPTASLFLQRILMYDSILTTRERELLYQEFLHSYPIQRPVVNVAKLRPVATFDGVDDLVVITDDSAIQNIFDGGGTIFAWINPRSDGGGDFGRIFDKNKWYFHKQAESGNKIELAFQYVFSGNNGFWPTTNIEVDLNKFSSVALTYNADDVANEPTIYVNNVSVAVTDSTPTGTRTSDVGQDLIIGNTSGAVRTFDGFIGKILLYNVILTTAELTNLHNGVLVTRGFAGHYKLNEGSGLIAYDSSPNENDGTINAVGNDFWQQTRGKLAANDVFISEDLTNQNADGQEFAVGQYIGDWFVESGTFKCIEAGVKNSPIEQLGSELIINGGFDTADDWVAVSPWQISGGVASIDGSQSSTKLLYQANVTKIGKLFKITYTVTSYVAGNVFVSLGTSDGIYRSAIGTYTDYLIAITNTTFYFNADSDFNGAVDNVSVKEVTNPIEKQVLCSSAGDLKLKGIDLSELVGNGYVKELEGDLSGDADGTVDDATNLSFANNILTVSMTAGQVLRKLTITRGA